MIDWPTILQELKAIRTRLDQIAAQVVSNQTREELWPIWDCGHKHAGRDEAIRCKRAQTSEIEAHS